ncbi:MAG: zinc metallopeptidase [Pseudomonadota bacterium]
MLFAILLIALLAALYGPSLWVRSAMRRHSREIEDMPGTGGELAQHLIERFELDGVKVEEASAGNDHYDPTNQTVRLSPEHLNGKSLTAIAIAAHEVGHAIQFARQEPISRIRGRWIPPALALRKSGILLLSTVPLLAAVVRVPPFIVAAVTCGLALQLIGALMYLIVLPEEWDASFNKALPILEEGYLPEHHVPAVREVLRAAAMTYFAGALADLLNVARWIMVLRR